MPKSIGPNYYDHGAENGKRLGARIRAPLEVTGRDSTPWFVWGVIAVAAIVILAWIGGASL